MAKCSATDTAMKVTTDAVQVYGGYGYTREYNVERHMRDAKVMQIVEGTNQFNGWYQKIYENNTASDFETCHSFFPIH